MTTYIAFLCCVGIACSCLGLLARERQPLLLSLYLSILLGLVVFMWHVSDPPELFSDFTQAYYPAGHAILQDVSRLYARPPGCDEAAVCGFVNIPAIAFIFAPLSLLRLEQAQWVFAILSLACIGATLYSLVVLTAATGWKRWALATLFVVNGPLLYSVREGNLTHVALLLIVLACICFEREQEIWVGALVACAAVIKLPLGLLGVYFLLQGRLRIVAGLGITLFAILGMSLLWAGWESHIIWYRESVLPFSSKSLAAFNVQSIDGFLLRLQTDPPLYSWTPVHVEWGLRLVRTLFVGLLLLISGIVLRRSATGDSKDSFYLDLSIVLCLALIISPISWTHYYLFLLVPFSLYLGGKFPFQPSLRLSVGVAVCILLTSPPVVFLNSSWGGALGRVVISHYLAGAMLFWGLLCMTKHLGTQASLCAVRFQPTSCCVAVQPRKVIERLSRS